MENQFAGMSDVPFSYGDFEETRQQLVADARSFLPEKERHFLVSFELGIPDWEGSEYREFRDYPSVRWKLLNLDKLKHTNPQKLKREADRLREVLSIS